MKKKLFILSVLSLVFVGIMFAVMFIPITTEDVNFDGLFNGVFNIFNLIPYAFNGISFFSLGFAYPIIALLFVIFVVIRAIKNIKLSKSEEEIAGKKLSVKNFGVIILFTLYGWFDAFLCVGYDDGDILGIVNTILFYFVPVIALMVINSKLKKLTIDKVEEKETK